MKSYHANKYGQLVDQLSKTIAPERLKVNELMSKHTSFKIGGPAKLLVEVASIEELELVKSSCKTYGAEIFVMGNGSNLLVSDEGMDRVVIKVAEHMAQVTVAEDDMVQAQAGVLLSALSNEIVKGELTGFEWASGIPGTLGGAICMNAGAYGGEMKDLVESVHVMDQDGKTFWLSNSEMQFGYRTSIIQTNGFVVLEAKLKLQKGDIAEIKATLADLTEKRTSKQPLHLPSAGSAFKRPEGYFAGKLIEDAGLKGIRHGGAQVSEKHSGFIVNVGGATCADVMNLVATIQKVVNDKFGVLLEPEVKMTV